VTVSLSRRALLALGPLVLVYAGVLMGSWVWASAVPLHASCPAVGVIVQVDSEARALSLCRDGVEEASFRVALGRGGLDKRAEGDRRTPRGRYPLGPARPSARYHRFVPVEYPTAAEAQRGFTGSAIGIHGPHAAFAWLGHSTVWTDWTRGCIAVGTRSDVARIAAWVSRSAAREVIIV
jgi:L,D-peptidoglycan transpeptidase YkuD (ErfK/YbiS/YcfS/YnhG family)